MGILIVSKRDGFRRAGLEHPSTPTLYKDDRFTTEQLEALENEPMLVVYHVADEAQGVKADATTLSEENTTPEPSKPDKSKDSKKDKAAKAAAAEKSPEEEAPKEDAPLAGDN